MLDEFGTIAGFTAIMINLVAVSAALPLSLKGRIALAGGVGLWVSLATNAASRGALAFSPEQPIPLVGVFFALPLVATATLWLASPKFQAALLAVPTALLVGLNSMRVLGALFFGLLIVGRLSGPFPYSAGLGDIITGLIAIPLSLALARGDANLEGRTRSWNLFGALDLFAAVALGLTSAEGSPLQIFHVGAGSEAMQHLPYSLIPTVLVPYYLITHGIVAAQLAARRRRQREDGSAATASTQKALHA